MVRNRGSDHSSNVSRHKKASGGKDTVKSKGINEKAQVANAANLREKVQTMMTYLPEVRTDRIQEIRDRIARGDYQVSSREIATRIVINTLAERPW